MPLVQPKYKHRFDCKSPWPGETLKQACRCIYRGLQAFDHERLLDYRTVAVLFRFSALPYPLAKTKGMSLSSINSATGSIL